MSTHHIHRTGLPAVRRRGVRGFTLIELMITVAIVAVLAGIAYPAYQDQVRKSRRSAAQATMLEVAQKQGQLLLDIRQYSAAADAAALAGAPLRVSAPASVTSYYNLVVTASNPTDAAPSFTVTATPTGGQTSDTCGTLTINQAGAKTPTSGCW